MYPRLRIDLQKFKHNAKTLLDLCNLHGISLAAVTKVFCADSELVKVLCDLPFEFLADSRLDNIESYPKNRKARSLLLRLPSPSEAGRVVQSCDVSCNSELYTLKRLSEEAAKQNKNHGIILMIDMGDLREGIYHGNKELINETADFIRAQSNLIFEGIGVNLTCYGGILPTNENLTALRDIARGLKVKIISGGNSSSLYLLEKGEMPEGINHLRLGESIIRGIETAFTLPFTGLELDVVTLEAEIIECMKKPSMPEGEKGFDAFGQVPHFEDTGIRQRAILAVGRQDTDFEGLTCLNPAVKVAGASSDHLIVDVTDIDLKVGDTLEFSMSYGAILAGFTSKYVKRDYQSFVKKT